MNHSWMSAIIRSENSVENRQVFWFWSSLRMSALHRAADIGQGVCRDLGVLGPGGVAVVVGAELFDLLIDDGVEEEGQRGGGRA